MNTTLFFLRSSEQKIACNLLHYAMCLDTLCTSIVDFPKLNAYVDDYGFNNTDIGIYALTNNEISGAAWIRLYREFDGLAAYIDNATPVLTIGVMPGVRGIGIGSSIMEQLLQEAAVMYEQISVSVQFKSDAVKFYERFGFVRVSDSESKSIIDGSDIFTMVKKLTRNAIIRPTDGYDPKRWMD